MADPKAENALREALGTLEELEARWGAAREYLKIDESRERHADSERAGGRSRTSGTIRTTPARSPPNSAGSRTTSSSSTSCAARLDDCAGPRGVLA